MSPFIILAILAAAVIVIAVSLMLILRRNHSTQKRLSEIRDSGTSKADSEPRQRKGIISSENFEKTKLASNDRVKRLTATITNELTSA